MGEFENDGQGSAPLSPGSSDENLIQGQNADGTVGDSSTGKHLLLFVPDFTNVAEALSTDLGANTTPLNSYLRLGMADSRAGDATLPDARALGEDLAARVTGFTDDVRDRSTGPTLAPGSPAAPTGYLPPLDPGQNALSTSNNTGTDYRSGESARLHQKGGWRDHSDGNRITTTRGDKIEVIRGNYKLLVLGRTDDILNAAGYEMSGGQTDTDGGDLGTPPVAAGLNMSWVWAADGDGKFRWHVTTVQGGIDTVDGDAGTASNPSIITTTFAFDVTSVTNANTITTTVTTAGDNDTTTISNGGSITSEASASDTITSTANASTITTVATARGGTINNTATAANINSTTSGGAVNSTVSGESVLNTTTATSITSLTATGAQTSLTLAGAGLTGNLIPISIEADVNLLSLFGQFCVTMITEIAAAVSVTNFNGLVIDCHRGIHIDNHSGLHIDNHSGIHLDVHAGGHIDDTDGTKLQAVMGSKMYMCTTGVHLTEAASIEMATTMIKLA